MWLCLGVVVSRCGCVLVWLCLGVVVSWCGCVLFGLCLYVVVLGYVVSSDVVASDVLT